jgi:RNA polymerase sigma factor (sigma-70 family)
VGAVRVFGSICSYIGVEIETADPPITEVERIYREDGRRLWWALLAYCGDPEIASDALAEAFAQLLRRGDAIPAPARWVWRAAFRIATGELERRRTTVAMTVEESYEIDEASEVLAALARLSPRQRAAIVLHYYAGYSLREIAGIVGSSSATVGVHLTRGRRKLHEVLEEER